MWTVPECDLNSCTMPCEGPVGRFNVVRHLELVPREFASALKRRLPRGRVGQCRLPSLRSHRGMDGGRCVLWAGMNVAR